MRKWTALLLSLVFCLSLCACGKNAEYKKESEAFVSLLDTLVPVSEGEQASSIPQITLDQGEDVQTLREMYDALSDGAKEYLGSEYAIRLQSAETGFDLATKQVLENAKQLVLEDHNMLKAYNLINDALPSLPEETATGFHPIELLANLEEIMQLACYPNTLFPVLSQFPAYETSKMIGYEKEETENYAYYKYFFPYDPYSKFGTDASNAFFFTYTNLLEEEYGLTAEYAHPEDSLNEIMENRCDMKYVEEQTGNVIYIGKAASTVDRTINGYGIGKYCFFYILIEYGENPPTYLTPKVSLAEMSKLVDQEETSVEDMADTLSGVGQLQAKPSTTQEKNALATALLYLNVMPFSHDGLVEQLKYEGFSESEAVYAADNCGADWNEQASLAAKQYLELFPFSDEELIEQLEYEGYTHDQAVYGAQ